MKKLKIAVVAGGDSTEREISLRGAAYVLGELDPALYESTIVTVSRSGWEAVLPDGKAFPIDKNIFGYRNGNGEETRFDFALILIHGTPGENGILQSYFELMDIPYSSSGVLSSALTFDKIAAKHLVRAIGIPVARERVVRRGEPIDTAGIVRELGLPLFVKPSGAGSSFGVTKVKDANDLAAAVENAFSEDSRVLVEEFLDGREVSCGIFTALGEEYVLPVTEIISENEYFDYQAKYEGKSNEVTPADLPETTVRQLNDACRRIYRELLCEGVVRIDFMVCGETAYMIEVNSVPGMSLQSIVPQQLRAAGLDTRRMYDLIIADKLQKKNRR